MDQLTVDFGVLRDLADSIARHIDVTTEDLDSVDELVRDLGRSWHGEAHDRFHDAIDEWSRSARELRDQLHWVREVVLNTHDNHARAVHANVSIWQAS